MSTPTPDRTDRVAVVIPAYNHARYVAEAVASAAAQGGCVAEIVVVDDGSSDATAEVVRGIAEPRLRLITQTNSGPSAARNRGWRSTSSPWIFFLDADDTLAPDALPALLSAVVPGRAPEIPYGFQEVYADGFGGAPHFTADLARVSGDLLATIASGYGATIFVGLFPRTAIEAIGGFDEAVHHGEDFDLALRLALRNRFRRIDQPVYRARMHGANRHRDFAATACLDYARTVERVFWGSTRPRELWVRQAGLAYRWMQYGCHLSDAGDRAGARRAFRTAWLHFPPRLGNLRAWILCR